MPEIKTANGKTIHLPYTKEGKKKAKSLKEVMKHRMKTKK